MKPPLRITIVQGAFLPVPPLLGGAVEKAWHALGREFARQGHAVTHVSRAHPDLPAEEIDGGVRHRRVAGFAAPRSSWRLKLCDLVYSLRARRVLPAADVLVTNTFWLPLLERRPSRGRPYVHVARYPKGQLRLYPRRAVFQTVSAPIRDAILREVPSAAARVRLQPYPLAPGYLVPRGEAERVVLYAGRLHPEKGVHLLIEAFARLQAAGLRDWKLRIVGPWEYAQGGGGPAYRARLAAAAEQTGGAVELAGPLFDEGRLVQEYRQAALFAYPSLAERGETFGLAILEAMAAGAAPVVSALACFRDFLEPGINGAIFDHRAADPAAGLAAVLGGLAEDAPRRERLRAAAWETARSYQLSSIALRFVRDFQFLQEHTGEIPGPNRTCNIFSR